MGSPVSLRAALPGRPITKKKMNKQRWVLLGMVLIPFAALVTFAYVPIWGWLIAFFKYSPGRPLFSSPFVGLDNFKRLFQGTQFLNVLRNTLALSFLSLAMSPVPLIFAILLNECRGKFFKRFIQTAASLPNFISWVIVYSIFFMFLSVEDGFINTWLINLGLVDKRISFLTNSNMVWPLQTFIALWKSMGWSAIVFLAGIAGIDQELYQAAEVDGAGRFGKIWHITLPGLMPTFTILLILSVGGILSNGFSQYWMFWNPLINNQIQVIDIYVVRMGIEQFNFSFATAVGIFKTIVSVILLVSVNSIAKRISGGTSIL